MPKSNHKYRVNVYLGKEIYEELEQTSNIMGVSVSTLAKILITTGYGLSKSVENKFKKGQETNGAK